MQVGQVHASVRPDAVHLHHRHHQHRPVPRHPRPDESQQGAAAGAHDDRRRVDVELRLQRSAGRGFTLPRMREGAGRGFTLPRMREGAGRGFTLPRMREGAELVCD